MVSQPRISGDMALLSPASMLICVGHSPVSPLAASPLMGSTAQSNRRNNVRRHFMAGAKGKAERLTPAPDLASYRKKTVRTGPELFSGTPPRAGSPPAPPAPDSAHGLPCRRKKH